MFEVGNTGEARIPRKHEHSNLDGGSEQLRTGPIHPALEIECQEEHRVSREG